MGPVRVPVELRGVDLGCGVVAERAACGPFDFVEFTDTRGVDALCSVSHRVRDGSSTTVAPDARKVAKDLEYD